MNKQFRNCLEGRQLLKDELPFSIDELNACHDISYHSGILTTAKGYQCTRCGNRHAHLFSSVWCARCHTTCVYCRSCITMGRVSACQPLLRWQGACTAPPTSASVLEWNGTLSEGQKVASEAVVKAISQKESCLVWAVCGAGKTEVLFHGIDTALQKGERVCIATPRTDVVLELSPRLKQAFPTIPIVSLYGGSPDRGKLSSLTIATTHQLLRYFHAFDTLILDEADAFPYSVDQTLQYAVEQARKPVSSIIYLTATPNESWKKEVRKGKRTAVTISARYHQKPLPLPSFSWCGNWQRKVKRQTLPTVVLRWIDSHLMYHHPVFLFVPHIAQIEPIVSCLKKRNPHIEGVHAEDPQRKEKVAAFRKGEIPLLVTTTILERGVTVPNLQVGVLGAEDQIFTESALVQIAGRAGRNAQFPDGDVIYFHYGKTEAMVAARNHIQKMNKEAKRRGWIL